MEVKNSDRFLAAFNQIHDFIKKETGAEGHIGFTSGLAQLRDKNYIVQRFYDDLRLFNDLRNVIVHTKNNVDYVIAEPHEDTVKRIEQIKKDLIEPEKVYPKFKKEVQDFDADGMLSDVLREVNLHGFSQFPVFDGGEFICLLTENGITKWLALSLQEDLVSLKDTRIRDVIGFEEDYNNFLFVSRNLSIYEAKEKFLYHINNGSVKLDALLITEKGKRTEKLLGIITAWDVIDL